MTNPAQLTSPPVDSLDDATPFSSFSAAQWGSWLLAQASRSDASAALSRLTEVPLPPDAGHWANADGLTPLMRAASRGRAELVQALLPYSNPLAQDLDGHTALTLAARYNHLACLRYLVPCGGGSIRTHLGKTALMLAATSHSDALECLRSLLPLSDPLAADRRGETVLMHAARSGCDRRVFSLLGSCCDATATNENGSTAFWIAWDLVLNTQNTIFWRAVDELCATAPVSVLQEVMQTAAVDECLDDLPHVKSRIESEAIGAAISLARAQENEPIGTPPFNPDSPAPTDLARRRARGSKGRRL